MEVLSPRQSHGNGLDLSSLLYKQKLFQKDSEITQFCIEIYPGEGR